MSAPSKFKEIGIDNDDLLKVLHERCGEVRCFAEGLPSIAQSNIFELIDSFCLKHGFTAIGEQWSEFAEEAATQHLAALLHRDMAYDSKMMSVEQARAIAAKFVDFCRPARYFSNTEVARNPISDRRQSSSWQPLTQATFDSGIVAVGAEKIALLWFEDED